MYSYEVKIWPMSNTRHYVIYEIFWKKTPVHLYLIHANIELYTLMKTRCIPWRSSIWSQALVHWGSCSSLIWGSSGSSSGKLLSVELLGGMSKEGFRMFIRCSETLTRKLLFPVWVTIYLDFTAEFSSSEWAFASLNHTDSIWLSHFACQPLLPDSSNLTLASSSLILDRTSLSLGLMRVLISFFQEDVPPASSRRWSIIFNLPCPAGLISSRPV